MAASLITRQPFKALYILLSTVYTGVRIPFWILYFIPSFLRQHPQWSYRQALVVRILSAVLKTVSTSEHGKSTPLHGSASKGWVVVQPARADAYTGVVSKDKLTKPVPIGGTWYPKTLQKYTGGDIVLHIHGGAFVIGDGRAGDSGFTAQSILKNSKASHTFLPQYRLSSNGARFPAALQDVITSYCYLTETLAIPEDRITISGDSAGANLSVSLLRYIADHPEAKLTSPRCAWLWSLWVDPGRSLITDPPFFSANARTDYLNDAFGTWGARTYTPRPETGITMAHPNICFIGTAFATPTPLFFSVGECEALQSVIIQAAREFKNVPGNKVEVYIEDYAVHDIILMGHVLGFKEQVSEAVKAAGKFLESCK
jgi:acetyl esterase/lipase